MTESVKDKQARRLEEGARNYAAADRSDPFAYARAKAHIACGIAAFYPNGESACYEAEPYIGYRPHPMTGEPFPVTEYKNRARP